MSKHVLKIRCPCCKKPIEIDTRNGKARAMATKDTALDDLVDAQKQESDRLGDLFESARDAHAGDSERLDGLFRKAADDTKDDDSKPRSPFDLE